MALSKLPSGIRKPRPPITTKGIGDGLRRQRRSLEKLPIRPTGPEHLHLGRRPQIVGGPGNPPEGFVGVWTSIPEWYVYWALCRLTEPQKDPRKPPFWGGERFRYQKEEEGGRVPGGSVTDFAVSTPGGWIGIRLETERWHIWTTADQQMKDYQIKTHLRAMKKVISIYDQHFLFDPSGQAVIRVVSLALKEIELPNPIRWGNAQRIRLAQ